MLVCVIPVINGAELLVWKPTAQPIARAEFVPQGLVDEMFVSVRYGQSVQSAPSCGAQASVDSLDGATFVATLHDNHFLHKDGWW